MGTQIVQVNMYIYCMRAQRPFFVWDEDKLSKVGGNAFHKIRQQGRNGR